MVTEQSLEKNTIKSFSRVKQDIKSIARWVAWNKKEHEILKNKIAELEERFAKLNDVRFIASVKTNKVHSENCIHASRIKEKNRLYFDLLAQAKEHGFKPCDCAV